VEREPGVKDPVKLREFITAVRAASPHDTENDPTVDGFAPYDWQLDF